ncbi:MAG TPA: methyltransferase domain-containing protein, partial [Gammaproteobacteria bacterium]|nr:methyltransferase domain-containing protein [Gammaproteobacteria bacterium]
MNFVGYLATDSGTTHSDLSVEESLDYIENVFADYQRISHMAKFIGKIAELGPGDSAGVGLMFLAHGAEQVDLADRFYSRRSHEAHEKVYRCLAAKYPVLDKMLSTVKFNQFESLPNLTRHYGAKASGEAFFDENRNYNVIVSRSVLEHVDQPQIVLRKMYNALKMGGVLIHKVDLRDHNMYLYSESVKFLELPQWLYHMMTYGSGYPNRFLFHDYKKALLALDPKSEFYIAGLHGVEEDMSVGYKVEDIPEQWKKRSMDFIAKHRVKFSAVFKNVAS